MKVVRIRGATQNLYFESAVSFRVRDLVEREVDEKIFSWGNGYHDIWVALHDVIEGW